MTTEQQIDLAKRHLAKIDIDPNVTFRGVTLGHFTAYELIKIVQIGLRQLDNERQACQTAIDGLRKALEGIWGHDLPWRG